MSRWKQTWKRRQKKTSNHLPEVAVNFQATSVDGRTKRAAATAANIRMVRRSTTLSSSASIRPIVDPLPWNLKLTTPEGSSLHQENVAHETLVSVKSINANSGYKRFCENHWAASQGQTNIANCSSICRCYSSAKTAGTASGDCGGSAKVARGIGSRRSNRKLVAALPAVAIDVNPPGKRRQRSNDSIPHSILAESDSEAVIHHPEGH